jgi:PleD family two-component response regulator
MVRFSSMQGSDKLRVLIVDDDATAVMTTSAILEDEGHTVTSRTEVFGTLAVAVREQPDVILIDIGMPGLRGDHLARLMFSEQRLSGTSLVLHSSLPEPQLAKLAKECGATGYIVKSSSSAQFLHDFHVLLSQRTARPQTR